VDETERDLPVTIGGRSFAQGTSYEQFVRKAAQNWEFTQTNLSDEYPLETYLEARKDVVLVGALGKSGLRPVVGDAAPKLGKDEKLLAFAPPQETPKAS